MPFEKELKSLLMKVKEGMTNSVVHNQSMTPREHFTMSGDILGCHKWESATGIEAEEVRDTVT